MKSFRPDKVASVVREIVADMIANRLQDPRISPFVSITRVEVTGDLQIAKVYVSVMGSDVEGRKTLAGLQHAGGHIQRAIAKALPLRHCPQLRFVEDLSIKKSAEIINLIDENVPRPIDDEPDGEAPDSVAPDDDSPDIAEASDGVAK